MSGKAWRNPAFFSGMGGIPVFLADLARVTGDAHLTTLARDGMRWILAEPQLNADPDDLSLYFGTAGIGMTALRVHLALGEAEWLHAAETLAVELEGKTTGGPDVMSGDAGILIFLLALHRATRHQRWLDTATAYGDQILAAARPDRDGLAWDWTRRSGVVQGSGFAHGASGIGYALVELYAETQAPRFRDVAFGALAWIDTLAEDTPQGAGWRRYPRDDDPPRVQWCHGAAGIGLFGAHGFARTGDPAFADLMRRCADATRAAGDVRQNPSQCHGLAGNGELFIEMARLHNDADALNDAHRFGALASTYHDGEGGNERWVSDEPGEFNLAFMLGAAGTGHYFLRLARPSEVEMPLMAGA